MKYIIAISALVFVIVSANAHRMHKIFPKCPHSEFFNTTKSECRTKVFGADATPPPPPPPHDGPHDGPGHGPNIDPAKKEEMKKCMSEKLGFDIFGTVTAEDADKFMATVAIENAELTATIKTAVTGCITEHKGVGKDVMGCIWGALEKNCN